MRRPEAVARLLRGTTWELARFCVVGASGYVVNVSVYAFLIHAGVDYVSAAAGAFAVAVTNNYIWNRLWTFRGSPGGFYDQGLRFLLVSLAGLGAGLLLLQLMVGLHVDKLAAQAIAIVAVSPLSFLASKVWAFARPQTAAVS
jgi:dolichol-phosphate mannosyltransferase